MKILGVDPGLSGALAVIEIINGVPMLLDVVDIPVLGSGAKARVDVIAASEWITKYAPSQAYVERVQAFPLQGRSSAFHFGRSTGAIETIVMLCRIPTTWIEPSSWKRKFHLPGKDKEAARQLAVTQFPAMHHLFARKRDHNRAEAALIALFGNGGTS
jgi:Holliday junction resolvasome RuvABC endonuclease subunit